MKKLYNSDEPVPPGFPEDWHTHYPGYHGFGRNIPLKGYVISLLVLGKQTYVGCTKKDQHEASLLHDLALWRLFPFTSKKTLPNHPYSFWDEPAKHNVERVQELLPGVEHLYQKLCADAVAQGLDVEVLLQERLAIFRARAATKTEGRYLKAAEDLLIGRTLLLLRLERLEEVLSRLRLKSVPEVQRALGRHRAAFACATDSLSELAAAITEHRAMLAGCHDVGL